MVACDSRISSCLEPVGFHLVNIVETGCIYDDQQGTCLILDQGICDLDPRVYPYVEYTSLQNQLFYNHERVFRFLLDEGTDLENLQERLRYFLEGGEDPEKVRRFGGNREEQAIDPTRPEAEFEEAFIEAFGDVHRNKLYREFPYLDLEGKRRYIDYVLFTKDCKIAIELNGEAFHHPPVIGAKRYRSQLFKQNSLVADGFKVYRWSSRGMKDAEKFISDLQQFLGEPASFCDRSVVKADRKLETLELHPHQVDVLDSLQKERETGRNNFLVSLPTGTGKTEIFIKDIERLLETGSISSALVLVPTRKLREQTVERFTKRLPQWKDHVGSDLPLESPPKIIVQTYATLHRHYYKLDARAFDYIVVDEAHHAPAAGLRRVLEHFNPLHLIGVTATPERFDRQRLEEIFGEYESSLTLEEAILLGLVPPVRCYRIRSNVDLSEVRFNGKDYVKSDLQKTLRVPSRDGIIAEILQKFFCDRFRDKQGVVFCVDIAHARRMARTLQGAGISALAVDGKDRRHADEAQQRYREGEVRFLCACDLLTEGWDAPQTQILVMARPTFSRVLYTQQLGRGLRHYPGKEALYVLDVVDNYGARLAPMSLHALLGTPNYRPFDDLIRPEQGGSTEEVVILDGLYEGVRKIEPVDIHTFESRYGGYLNEEQLARELFVSTGTVKAWLKKGTISADYTHPFGRSTLHFFDPAGVDAMREQLGLPTHSEETRYRDFMDFLEKRDYTFSYKMIFLLAFLKIRNDRGEADLPSLTDLYHRFYRGLLDRYGRCEKEKNPYNRSEYLEDRPRLQRSLLQNPFEKFERKRFFYHCRDLKYIAMDPVLREHLNDADDQKIREQMVADLKKYYARLEISLEVDDYLFLVPDDVAIVPQEQEGAGELVLVEDPPREECYNHLLPFYPLKIAAGAFLESPVPQEPEGWVEMEGRSRRFTFDDSMFVARVQGRSMEPTIPDGSYCLFTFNVGGSRQGKIVLARYDGFRDEETGEGFTIKRYFSEKRADPETGWRHKRITLRPDNPEFDEIPVPEEEAEDFKVVAFFVEVLQKERT